MKYSYTVTVTQLHPFRQVQYHHVMARDAIEAVNRAKSMCINQTLVRDGEWRAKPTSDEDPVEM